MPYMFHRSLRLVPMNTWMDWNWQTRAISVVSWKLGSYENKYYHIKPGCVQGVHLTDFQKTSQIFKLEVTFPLYSSKCYLRLTVNDFAQTPLGFTHCTIQFFLYLAVSPYSKKCFDLFVTSGSTAVCQYLCHLR